MITLKKRIVSGDLIEAYKMLNNDVITFFVYIYTVYVYMDIYTYIYKTISKINAQVHSRVEALSPLTKAPVTFRAGWY